MSNKLFGAVVLTIAICSHAVAGTSTYDNQTAFLNDVAPDVYLEDFSAYSGFVPGPLSLSNNGYSYCISEANRLTANDPPGSFGFPSRGLYAGGGAMSTDTDYDEMSIDFEGNNFVGDPCVVFDSGESVGSAVTAVGGNFWLTDFNFQVIGSTASCPSTAETCDLIITATDNSSTSTSLTFTEPPSSTFVGFTSDVPISRIVLDSTVLDTWVTVDNLYVGTAAPDCDFNNNLVWNVDDIDLLVEQIASGTFDGRFDVDGDLVNNTMDLNACLAEAAIKNFGPGTRPYFYGDANLDGIVDMADFNAWATNRFTAVAAWSKGDFNASGVNDFLDFNIWSENRFESIFPLGAVPEPSSWALIALSLLLATGCRRQHLAN